MAEILNQPNKRKSFKKYMLEGFMIFLAVFMGFVAENIRENISEASIEQEMAKNLYAELESDSIKLAKIQIWRKKKEHSFLYVMKYLKDSSLVNLSNHFYRHFTFAVLQIGSNSTFDPTDGLLIQLQNSGTRRYFKNPLIQKQVSELGATINFVRIRNERELGFSAQIWRPLIQKHYDFEWLEEFMDNGKRTIAQTIMDSAFVSERKPHFVKENQVDREELYNATAGYLLTLRGTSLTVYNDYKLACAKLLQTLRQEYKLSPNYGKQNISTVQIQN
ncbi:MAG: hypothetical protein ACKO96_00745 [Flammeovirgaceae bacterium]